MYAYRIPDVLDYIYKPREPRSFSVRICLEKHSKFYLFPFQMFIPVILIGCVLRAIILVTQVPVKSFYVLVMLMADIVGLVSRQSIRSSIGVALITYIRNTRKKKIMKKHRLT